MNLLTGDKIILKEKVISENKKPKYKIINNILICGSCGKKVTNIHLFPELVSNNGVFCLDCFNTCFHGGTSALETNVII